MSWTDERIAVLKALWADGMSASRIAERLGGGMSRNAVIGKVHRLGLPARAPTPARFRKARTGDMASAKAPKKHDPVQHVTIVKPKPEPAPKPVVVKAKKPRPMRRNIDLTELIAGACRWPVNDPPRGGKYLFCGDHVLAEKPYCVEHSGRAFVGTRRAHPEEAAFKPRAA